MRRIIFSAVCLLVIVSQGLAQPAPGLKDTTFRSITGPSSFLNKPQKTDSAASPSPSIIMPRVEFYHLEPGNKENLPPGLIATFEPPLPDTVKVFEGGTEDFVTIKTKATKEVIQGDS